MTSEQFEQCVRKHLDPKLIKKSGRVLFSSLATIRPGPVYLLGTNPGGNQETLGTIEQDLNTKPWEQPSWSAFNENWDSPRARTWIQGQLKWIIGELTGRKIEEVPASNLIFLRSWNVKEIDKIAGYDQEAIKEQCWRIHQEILNIVQPKCLLVFGNGLSGLSPYKVLRDQAEDISEDECVESGHSRARLRSFHGKLLGRPVTVAGIPHVSRYWIKEKPQMSTWLGKIRKSLDEG